MGALKVLSEIFDLFSIIRFIKVNVPSSTKALVEAVGESEKADFFRLAIFNWELVISD